MKDIPDDVRVAIFDGEALARFKASPGADVLRRVLDDEAKKAVLAMLCCKPDELMEWRGRAQALFSVMDQVDGRIGAAQELATRIRREAEEAQQRERASLEREIERGQRASHEAYLERDGAFTG